MSIAIERQVIVTWYDPAKKLPPDGKIVVVTASGRANDHVTWEHTFGVANYIGDTVGWWVDGVDPEFMDTMIIHAWCDLEPFGGRDA